MLNRRVMTGLVNRFGDAVTKLFGLVVFVDVLRSDDTRGITGARGGYRVVKRIFEIIFKLNNRFRGKC